jgi:hypothetical protein
MSEPIKTRGRHDALWAHIALAVTAIAALSALAISVAVAQTPVPMPTPQAGGAVLLPAPSVQARSVAQIRCWQYGRLVIEEPLTQPLADGGPQSIRLQGSAGSASAVTLVTAGTTTCLVKPASVR